MQKIKQQFFLNFSSKSKSIRRRKHKERLHKKFLKGKVIKRVVNVNKKTEYIRFSPSPHTLCAFIALLGCFFFFLAEHCEQVFCSWQI